MSSILYPYPSSPLLPSPLVLNHPDVVPPIDDLEALQAELKLLQRGAYERAKKADDDIRVAEESMRWMKEKEKGRAKALEKARKDIARACFPIRSSIECCWMLILSVTT